MSTLSRAERRKAKKEAERKQQEEIGRILEEPPPPAFEAPATGKIVDSRRKTEKPKE